MSDKNIYKKNWLGISVGFFVCTFVRLIPFRPPNIEPILATQMPFSKHYGPYLGFSFAFFSIIFFDLITNHFGIWSLITGFIYGALGFLAFAFFKHKEQPTRMDYVRFAIIGTLFFDFTTGLTIGPIFFEQTFLSALSGQIPFTLWHLLGNISFAYILSPAIYKLLIKKRKTNPKPIIKTINLKTI
ncbi:hypothetical protein COU49_01910 [Candidatus Nomurabacteria bacterium CG10_big_fil_rev_8_21_14_0_10_35_16]|uniref:Rod shape-determining protein MreD n=1 Tax=Candidatus Nomurabacteria bacterium CG10_big_fil_rev_8_21_14_0_10_35_16 TaxID=1974731 RepID=A0A2H0TB94_9BACT|nr:MAG: hypothetical protein COU49_01910 [Candidatus Nomurabacteria bacterium CG10_big_fil_rev_8_21_14_0_10_35_16]